MKKLSTAEIQEITLEQWEQAVERFLPTVSTAIVRKVVPTEDTFSPRARERHDWQRGTKVLFGFHVLVDGHDLSTDPRFADDSTTAIVGLPMDTGFFFRRKRDAEAAAAEALQKLAAWLRDIMSWVEAGDEARRGHDDLSVDLLFGIEA